MDRAVKIVLIILAALSLTFGAAALFFPIKQSFIKGMLEGGAPYQNQWYTHGYNSVGGYLLLLVGLINTISSVQLFRGRYEASRGTLWAIFSGILVGSIYLVGDTIIINWFSFLPSEIMHAIGTSYVELKELSIVSPWLILGTATTILFVATALVNYVLEASEQSKI